MKIAITSDLHLDPKMASFVGELPTNHSVVEPTSRENSYSQNTYQKWQVLEEILVHCRGQDISQLLIAGDLLDRYATNTGLDVLFNRFSDITIHIIPGNHDDFLTPKLISSSNANVFVHDQPCVTHIEDISFVFMPYRKDISFIQEFQKIQPFIPPKHRYVFVSHCDLVGEAYENNYTEKKIYFPLTRQDLIEMKPDIVFLGHIHQPSAPVYYGNVYYTGSPCACSSNETGIRSFLIFEFSQNTDHYTIERKTLTRGILYYQEKVFVFPGSNEEESIVQQTEVFYQRILKEVGDSIKKRVHLSIKVRGASIEGKGFIERTLRDYLAPLVGEVTLDVSALHVAADPDIQMLVKELTLQMKEIFGTEQAFEITNTLSPNQEDIQVIMMEAFKKLLEAK